MTGFNHGMTGAVIALTIKQPALAIPLAFLSHYLQDMVPHFEYAAGKNDEGVFSPKFNKILAADAVLSVSLMVVLGIIFPAHRLVIWACMVAAACPDVVWAYYFMYVKRIRKQKVRYDPLTRLHRFVQWSATPKGIIGEIIWAIVFGSIILHIKLS